MFTVTLLTTNTVSNSENDWLKTEKKCFSVERCFLDRQKEYEESKMKEERKGE